MIIFTKQVQNTEHMSKKALKKFRMRQEETDNEDSQNNQTAKSNLTSDPNLYIEALIALQKIVSKGNYLLKSKFYEVVSIYIYSNYKFQKFFIIFSLYITYRLSKQRLFHFCITYTPDMSKQIIISKT